MLKKMNKIQLALWILFFVILTILIFIDPNYIFGMPLLFIGNDLNGDGIDDDLQQINPENSTGTQTPGQTAEDKAAAKAKKSTELLKDIAAGNKEAIENKYNQSRTMYDIANQQIMKQWEDDTDTNASMSGEDWFKQLLALQNSADALKNQSGGSLSGSNVLNFWDMLEKNKNNMNADTLKTQRENQNKLNNELFEKLSANVNAQNELGINTEYAIKQLVGDTKAQMATIDPDTAEALFGDFAGWGDNFFNEHTIQPAEHKVQGYYTESNAQQKANDLLKQNKSSHSGSANQSYWEDIDRLYNKKY